MANVFDYLSWRGDLSFSAAPFCEADNLILCLLSYLDFSHMVLEGDTVGLPLELLPLITAAATAVLAVLAAVVAAAVARQTKTAVVAAVVAATS